jgi:hypothetical protein
MGVKRTTQDARATTPRGRVLFRPRAHREGHVGKQAEQDAVRRAIAGPPTDQRRREVAERVSEPVKRAINQAIKQNRPALRELANY